MVTREQAGSAWPFIPINGNASQPRRRGRSNTLVIDQQLLLYFSATAQAVSPPLSD